MDRFVAARLASVVALIIGAAGLGQGNVPVATAVTPSQVVGWGAGVPVVSGARAVASGSLHSLAVMADGSVAAWGDNGHGQADVPSGLADVVAISAGDDHSLALTSDGKVVAWGLNEGGQTDVPAGLADVVAISAGSAHSLALTSDGTVVAWGSNEDGQTDVPTDLAEVKSIAAGPLVSVAVKADGTVAAWGAGAGDPTALMDLVDVVAVSAGSDHLLALTSDGSVMASSWAQNEYGEADVPTDLSDVVAVAAGEQRSLALKSNGTIVAWGNNQHVDLDIPAGLSGVTAIATGGYQTLAVNGNGAVIAWGGGAYSGEGLVPGNLAGATSVAAGSSHNLALESDGTVVAWGINRHGQTDVPVGLSGVVAVAAGATHSLALKSDGTVVGWGGLYSGSPFYGEALVPPGLSGVTMVAAGGAHSLALKSDGTVAAWGRNSNGQCTVPAGLSGVIAVAAGGYHSMALKSDGSVVAWGAQPFEGEIYDFGQTRVPASLTGVVAIAAGNNHSLALQSDGTVVAWGDQSGGKSAVPDDLSGVVAVAAGDHHSLALTSDGTVHQWGVGWVGTAPAELSGVTGIAAGSQHSLALVGGASAVLSPAPVPTISDSTPVVGQTLTAVPGVWGPLPVGLAFQWFRGSTAIEGATSATYSVRSADAGAALKVAVTGSKPGHTSVTRTSSATAVVSGGVLSPTPSPMVSDTTPVTDQVLEALPGAWGPEGVAFTYQWSRRSASGTTSTIVGATARTYKVQAADVGYTLRAKVTGSLSGFGSVSKTSAYTSAVAKASFSGVPVPLVSGVVRVSMPVTVNPGTWEPSATLKYQWYRVSSTGTSSAITGATKGSYTPTSGDVARRLKVRVSASRSGYVTTTRYSALTSLVLPGMVGVSPKISDTTPRVDQLLTANEGTWTPADVSISYQWSAKSPSGAVYPITGATKQTYRVEGKYAGYKIKVQATGSKTDYAPVSKTSSYTYAVAKATFTSKPVPTISGTAQVGQTLSVVVGEWAPSPTGFSYRWYRSGSAITGATKASYALTSSDKGKTITVKVTASRTGYNSSSATSAPTGPVAA